MELRLERFEFGKNYTIGRLYNDNYFECYTLERGINESDRKSCIPYGVYPVVIDQSARFGCLMPHVLNVSGYEGIRIHKGNSDKDTEGCILVGTTWAGVDWIGNSKTAFDQLFFKMQSTDRAIQLEIKESGT